MVLIIELKYWYLNYSVQNRLILDYELPHLLKLSHDFILLFSEMADIFMYVIIYIILTLN